MDSENVKIFAFSSPESKPLLPSLLIKKTTLVPEAKFIFKELF